MNQSKTYFPQGHFSFQPIPPKRKNGKFKIAGLLGLLLIAGYFFWPQKPDKESSQSTAVPEVKGEENVSGGQKTEPEEESVIVHTISEGDIPAEVFSEFGKFDANDMETLLECSENIYDFTKLKIGRDITFSFGNSEKAKRIKYYPDTEFVIIAEHDGEKFSVKKEDIPYEKKTETLYVKIDEFLYKDALDAGLSEASILEIADIFSFDIDFTTEIRQGDEMKVIYEKRTLDGKAAPDGNILAARFRNDGRDYFAYYFESKGEGSHYDLEGRELMRQFLRAPLSYRRITSGYTGARLHPITKTVSAHYQIDYAAAVGTPVVATARGTIASAGWEGGWGNIVRLRHDNGYTTHYGHLSGFAKGVRSGASVSQGQVIGYVGSTGWSTGPHLDYGMKLNGSPINPLSLKLPKGVPLGGDEMERFIEKKKEYDKALQ